MTAQWSPTRRTMENWRLEQAIIESGLTIPRKWLLNHPDDPRDSTWGKQIITEVTWGQVRWNPIYLESYTQADGWHWISGGLDSDASPKPTWNEVVAYFRSWTLRERVQTELDIGWVERYIIRAKETILAHPLESDTIETAATLRGILSQSANRTTFAEVACQCIHRSVLADRTIFMGVSQPEVDRQAALDRVLLALTVDTVNAAMNTEIERLKGLLS